MDSFVGSATKEHSDGFEGTMISLRASASSSIGSFSTGRTGEQKVILGVCPLPPSEMLVASVVERLGKCVSGLCISSFICSFFVLFCVFIVLISLQTNEYMYIFNFRRTNIRIRCRT